MPTLTSLLSLKKSCREAAALNRPNTHAAAAVAEPTKTPVKGLSEIIGGKECAITPQLDEKFSSWTKLPIEPLFITLVRFVLPAIDELSCKALILAFSGVDLQERNAKVTKKSNRKAKLSRAAVNHYATWQALIASARLLFHASGVSSSSLKKCWDMDEFFSIRVALFGKRQRLTVKDPAHAHSLQQIILGDLKPEWIEELQQPTTPTPVLQQQQSSSSSIPPVTEEHHDEIDSIMAFINSEDTKSPPKTLKKKRGRKA